MNRLREVTIRDRIVDLGVTNVYILKIIHEKSGQTINRSQFSAAIKKRTDLREPREKEIAELAEAVISEMEVERKM